jgi:hypothetical protein
VCRQPWRISDHGGIDVSHRPAQPLDLGERCSDKRPAVGIAVTTIRRGKLFPEVWGPDGTQQRIGQGMQQHIRIRVAPESATKGNSHTSKP